MLTEILGRQLNLDDSGAGESVLLLHAAASSGIQWVKTKKTLNPHYRVLIPDLPGEGQTPGRGDWSDLLESDCDAILALAQSAGGAVHLVGHSYGAVLAMRLAAQCSNLFSSLVLIEPVAFNLLREYPLDEDHEKLLAVKASCESALAAGDGLKAARLFISYWSGESSWQKLPPSLQEDLAGVMPKVVHGWRAIAADPAGMPFYEKIRTPTLLIAGDSGPKPIRWVTRQLARHIPSATFTRIPGAGHMSPLTHPGAVTDAIHSHIRSTETRKRLFSDAPADDWQPQPLKRTPGFLKKTARP